MAWRPGKDNTSYVEVIHASATLDDVPYGLELSELFLDEDVFFRWTRTIVSAFTFLGGSPWSILYDNTRLAVAKILGDGRLQRTRAFTELQSHYLFDDRFERPGKGREQGKVEGPGGVRVAQLPGAGAVLREL